MDCAIDTTPAEEWKFTLDVMLNGVFYGMKHAAAVMKHQGSGSIISMSSVAGVTGGLGPHAYAAAKQRLFRHPGLACAVLNHDDPFGRELLPELAPDVAPVLYGCRPSGPLPSGLAGWIWAEVVTGVLVAGGAAATAGSAARSPRRSCSPAAPAAPAGASPPWTPSPDRCRS